MKDSHVRALPRSPAGMHMEAGTLLVCHEHGLVASRATQIFQYADNKKVTSLKLLNQGMLEDLIKAQHDLQWGVRIRQQASC